MTNIKLTIEYHGLPYSGWQSQKNEKTVQDEIQKAINKDRYLSKEDAILLNKFFKKIQKEINEAENN